jgi:hypothetical protein
MIPIIIFGENQPKTLIGSHSLSETHPPLVLTLRHKFEIAYSTIDEIFTTFKDYYDPQK